MDRNINYLAVSNFIGSMDLDSDIWVHLLNLVFDKRVCKWNDETYNEIRKHIFNMYQKKQQNTL